LPLLFFTPATIFKISRSWKLTNVQVWAFQKRLLGAIFILFKIKYLQKIDTKVLRPQATLRPYYDSKT